VLSDVPGGIRKPIVWREPLAVREHVDSAGSAAHAEWLRRAREPVRRLLENAFDTTELIERLPSTTTSASFVRRDGGVFSSSSGTSAPMRQ
jgi:hypothetical protein